MGMTKYNWNGNRIKVLREKVGCSQKEAAEKIGVSLAAYCKYEQNKMVPGFFAVMKIAKFYCVPVDYLIGRTEYKDAEKVFSDTLRELKGSDVVKTSVKRGYEIKGVESSYPYNLLEAINEKNGARAILTDSQQEKLESILEKLEWRDAETIKGFFCDIDEATITEDQLNGLKAAVSTLRESEQTVIRMRFEEYATLDKTGETLGCSRERARQLEARAIRKLRHPARRKLYRFGLGAITAEADKYERELKRLNEAIEAVSEAESTLDAINNSIEKKRVREADTKIEDLNLGIRPYNCLKRAGVETVGELTNLTTDELRQMRSMGVKSFDEIVGKLAERGLRLAN